ncbi:hypothetical protein CRG98_036807 [Punica granatum]|uniref:Uncharacterized protein n=1 Tax=Punica granatum TaxID=22663 RepID=A0A2I0IFK9_PUNGR|nr:hypothetical protein CRG98_036807 [Punica granatum]
MRLGLLSIALKVSDILFKALEVQSRQTEITVISKAPKQLRKQSEKSSFGLLGRLRLHICITGLRSLSYGFRCILGFEVHPVLSGEQWQSSQPRVRTLLRALAAAHRRPPTCASRCSARHAAPRARCHVPNVLLHALPHVRRLQHVPCRASSIPKLFQVHQGTFFRAN